jgi:iron complex transport system ATP-binding protein
MSQPSVVNLELLIRFRKIESQLPPANPDQLPYRPSLNFAKRYKPAEITNRQKEDHVATPLVELMDVTYTLNGNPILDHISWKIMEGENWAILGPNGAGKTSLLKMIYGTIWPNRSGEISRRGSSHTDLGHLRRAIGWLTSNIGGIIPRNEPVVDTVISGKFAQLGLWMLPGETVTIRDKEKAITHLRHLGCEHLSGRRFGTLSQGEQQKVLICRALMAEPYLLILDEPCAGLDPGSREVFLSGIESLGNKGECPALVFVTHHPEEVLPLFSHVLFLKGGSIIGQGAKEELLTSIMMRRAYDVSFDLLKKNDRYWPVIG